MPKDFMKVFTVALAAVMLSGCASGGLTVRNYSMDKERVDQDLSQGNGGFLFGEGSGEPQMERKKTRRVYVLEVTKEAPEPEVEVTLPPRRKRTITTTSLPPEPKRERKLPSWAKPVEIPSYDEIPVQESMSTETIKYTVQKGDTLQKISKKFYDSYSKWPRIYDLNKDVISDPNHVSPGMVLRVPVDAADLGPNLK